jgi:uncharacterized protein
MRNASQSYERIASLDVARRIAILGILIANVSTFAFPSFGEPPNGMIDGTQYLVDQWVTSLGAGKFRSALGLLFGYGLAHQYRRAVLSQATGTKETEFLIGPWQNQYFRRMFYLGLLGFIHETLIWYGDILFTYSIVGALAARMIRAESLSWKWIIGGSYCCGLFCGVGMLAGSLISPSSFAANIDFWPMGWDNEISIHQSPNYMIQVGSRSLLWPISSVLSSLFIIPSLLGMFGLGILMARRGVLEAPSTHPRMRNIALGLGLGLGIPLNLGALLVPGHALDGGSAFWELAAGPLLAVGWLMLVAVLVERYADAPAWRPFANVGRLALSNYLLQSVFCTAIFYGWGGGFFGRLTAAESMLIVPVVWSANLAFSWIWIRFFQIGPLEWLWRSAARKGC